jgi:hypothetical protein
MEHDLIERAIHKSQHCQRNWDLSRSIPQEDLDLLITAISQCPSKQNIAFYRAHFITRRDLIEKIHERTNGFIYNYENGSSTTNTQTLANLLVVFESVDVDISNETDAHRNNQTYELSKSQKVSPEVSDCLERDRNMAIGIAAGYLNLTSSLRGYATGCCACFDPEGIREILGCDGWPALLMGIGFNNPEVGRRVHHLDADFVFPTKPKQPISVNIIR